MKNSIFYRLFILIFLLVLGLLLVGSVANADPNSLLADSIKKQAAINANTPIEERLELYSQIFKNLDLIVLNHSNSDQAIKILSNQKIGNFNPQSLRDEYIKELTQFYDTCNLFLEHKKPDANKRRPSKRFNKFRHESFIIHILYFPHLIRNYIRPYIF